MDMTWKVISQDVIVMQLAMFCTVGILVEMGFEPAEVKELDEMLDASFLDLFQYQSLSISSGTFEQIFTGLLFAGLSPRDLRKLQCHPTFQAIRDRNHQLAFVPNFERDNCKVPITSHQLADIFQISSGRVRSLVSTAPKRDFDHPTPAGHPIALKSAEEERLIWEIVCDAHHGKIMTKSQLLGCVYKLFNKRLTFGWVDEFLVRQAHAIISSAISPQENSRREVPRDFPDEYITLIKTHLVSMDPGLVYNIDETGCSDWAERKGIIPTSMAKNRIHFAVSRKIPHQTMLIYVSTSGEALCPLIVTMNPVTLGIFQRGVQEGVDAKIRVNSSSYVNADIFYDYSRDVFIYHIDNC
jgi:hypothetical protein